MTIPKSYEALAADLASEKILSKTLLGQKEAYMMLADNGRLDLATWKQKACEAAEREAALRESLTDKREEYNKLGDRYDDLQQRLTVAEQRAGEMVSALNVADQYLCAAESLLDRGEDDSLNLEPAIIAVRDALKAALKPAEDPFGVLAETGMTYPEFMRSTFQERHKLTDAECEEFHVWKKNRGKPSEEGEGS